MSIHRTKKAFQNNKIGCILPMIIWSKFRLGKYRDEDHREDASHFGSLWQQIEEQDIFFWKLSLRIHQMTNCIESLVWYEILKCSKNLNYEQGTQNRSFRGPTSSSPVPSELLTVLNPLFSTNQISSKSKRSKYSKLWRIIYASYDMTHIYA